MDIIKTMLHEIIHEKHLKKRMSHSQLSLNFIINIWLLRHRVRFGVGRVQGWIKHQSRLRDMEESKRSQLQGGNCNHSQYFCIFWPWVMNPEVERFTGSRLCQRGSLSEVKNPDSRLGTEGCWSGLRMTRGPGKMVSQLLLSFSKLS